MEWELGWVTGRIPFFALQDSDDYEVISANSLVGYSCLGDFVLQTGYFDDGEAYPVNTPVTPDGTTGDLTITTADSGDPIVGYIKTAVTDPAVGQNGVPAISGVTATEVIEFATAWVPNPALS